jgi:hypothetical protein
MDECDCEWCGERSPADHVELGAMLKRARALLLDAAKMVRVYGRLSDHLFDAADALCAPRSFLEKRLIDEVGGEDVLVEGVHVRDVYFGELKEAAE